jgi:peptide/nickel transport system substrate-binding protein
MRIRPGWVLAVVLSALVATATAEAQKKTLVIALNQDADILDPTLSRTYVGRIIYTHMCEKLYELDENLKISPQLAADLPVFADGGKTVTIKRSGVKFNDGTPLNAEAMKYSLDRHREMKGSSRRSELDHVDAVEVVDPLTVRLRLKAPFSPITAILADRAGMPVSPTQAKKLDDKFGTAPVCVGPWAFTERVAQDRIVLDKSPHYFDPSQAKFDRLVFRIIPDDNVRLANLRSGDIDFMHLVNPIHAASLKKEAKFEVASVTGIGYTDQVVWEGQYTPGCTPISPVSPFHDKGRKCPARDVARAKKLLADAGLANGYNLELTVFNEPPQRRMGEVIQQMAKEAGFNISIRPSEFAASLNDDDAGKLQAYLVGWSGRVDPDANIHQFHTCQGSLNTTHACDEAIDSLLTRAREVSDLAQRVQLYREAVDKFGARRNILYLYHINYIAAFPKNLKGYKAVPDGLIRVKGASWN